MANQPDALIGSNDYSFRPASLDLAEDPTVDSAFPVRWRTRRLILLLIDWLRSTDSDKSAPFVGVWHSDVVDVEFNASGDVQFGDQRLTWSVDDDGLLQLQMPDGEAVPIHWRLEGARLYIESTAWTQAFLLEPGPLPGPPSGVLQDHLRQIVATCQLAGARCVLLNYPGGPYARPGLNEQLRRAARALNVDLVDIQERFEAIAAAGDVETYYVADGHCSDRGYAEIARLVAEHAMRLPR